MRRRVSKGMNRRRQRLFVLALPLKNGKLGGFLRPHPEELILASRG
jgi:hypothetical protein